MALRATEGDENCAGPLADARGSVCAFVRDHETLTEPRPEGAVFHGSGAISLRKGRRPAPHCTLMVAVAGLDCPPIVITTGTLPDGVLGDNRMFIWFTPPTNPGADPE